MVAALWVNKQVGDARAALETRRSCLSVRAGPPFFRP